MANEAKRDIALKAVATTTPKGTAFLATYYNPTDPRQTKPSGNGIGAFGKKVEFGDVAMGRRIYKQGDLIKIAELSDVKTPYGMGVFRVNDKKNKRYDTQRDSFDVALPTGHPQSTALAKRIGNNTFHFERFTQPTTTPEVAPIAPAPVAPTEITPRRASLFNQIKSSTNSNI